MASTTLDDIITELRLTYDSSVGVLEGDHIQSVPKISVLSNLSKLLSKLDRQLSEVEQIDKSVLKKIKKIAGDGEGDEDGGEVEKKRFGLPDQDEEDRPESEQRKDKIDGVVDGEDANSNEEDDAAEGEGEEEEEDDEEPEDDGADGIASGADKANGAAGYDKVADDDVPLHNKRKPSVTDDEDDVGLAKRRKLVKSETDGEAYGKEKEIKFEDENANVDADEDDNDFNEGDDDDDGDEHEDGSKVDKILPPEQRGHYTHENDTRLKNPKSEFVTSQTLPAEAIAKLGLFSESNNGLETHGKEYLKKKYGVASYPENDLYDLLPGPIPSTDFSKNKPPSNQVQFTTFQSYIESFFRPFVPEDIDFLKEKYVIPAIGGFDEKLNNYDPATTPFLIPKLGPFYADLWTAADSSLANKISSPSPYQQGPDSYLPKGSIDNLSDDKLYTEDISCGPLSSRLLSAILCNNESGELDGDDIKNEENFNDDDLTSSPVPQPTDIDVATQLDLNNESYKLTSEKSDFHSIEERLKRELKYIGIFMNLPNGKKKNVNDSNDDTAASNSINGGTSADSNDGTGSGTGAGDINNGGGSEGPGGNGEGSADGSHIIDNDEWIKNREDDEVCAELRALQRELHETHKRNRQNKKKLIPIVDDQLAFQEYCTILEDLDKQVDQAYIKRLRVKNKKKKGHAHSSSNAASTPGATGAGSSESTTGLQQTVNSGLRSLLDKRSKWIDNIGKLFKSPELMKRAPSESILSGAIESDDEADDEDHIDTAAETIMNKGH